MILSERAAVMKASLPSCSRSGFKPVFDSVFFGRLTERTTSVFLLVIRYRANKISTSSGIVRLNFGTCCVPYSRTGGGVVLSGTDWVVVNDFSTLFTVLETASLSCARESKWNLKK